MKSIAILLALLFSAIAGTAEQLPPLPRKSMHPHTTATKGAELLVSSIQTKTIAIASAPVSGIAITWGYPFTLPQPGVTFEIWKSTDLFTWTQFDTVSAPPYQTTNSGEPAAFFRVRPVRNGLTGDWATTQKQN